MSYLLLRGVQLHFRGLHFALTKCAQPMIACRSKELAVLAGTTLTYSISTSKGDNEDFVQIVPDRTDDGDDSAEEECFLVACPDGVVPGDVVYVTSPLGQEIELTVPEVHYTCTPACAVD